MKLSNQTAAGESPSPQGEEALLAVEDLSVTLPVPGGDLHAVQEVSFQVQQGRTLCIVGESGCGKSMSALGVMGLLPLRARRRARRLFFDGADLLTLNNREMADIRGSQMAMIFQEPMTSLNPAYTIGNQLMEVMRRHRRVERNQARNRAVFLLEKVGITAAARRLDQYPHQLSGGLRQRVMIAMSLMCDPKLLLADEPTTALDVTIQAQILHLLGEIKKEFRMGLILITHDLGVVSRVADDVCVMYAGQVFESQPVKDLFKNPLHPYTQGLMACIPVPGRTKRGRHLGSIPGIVPTMIGPSQGCSFKNRCPQVFERCRRESPPLNHLDSRHAYRCFLSAAERRRNPAEATP